MSVFLYLSVWYYIVLFSVCLFVFTVCCYVYFYYAMCAFVMLLIKGNLLTYLLVQFGLRHADNSNDEAEVLALIFVIRASL